MAKHKHKQPARAQAPAAPAQLLRGRILLTVHDLPRKGITFRMNHLRKLWRRGDFPSPVKLSERRTVWDEAQIDAWLDSKFKAAS